MKAGAQEQQLKLCSSVLESNGTVTSDARQIGNVDFTLLDGCDEV